ncbi:MAG: FliM/FliN family flagellar motor switch protein, partial [Pseudomonadales bacterium]|nr:FliM/FliN family flagellar motor switch protein [Pseudomonadales bacterium]
KLAIMKSKTVQSGRSRIQSFRVKGVSRFGKQNHKLHGKPQGDQHGKKQDGNTMNTETTERQSKETSNNILKQMPVNLSFQLGELTLTLEQLQDIQPGYVFELAERLDQTRAIVVANGKAIGEGELIAVGETLGIRLTEFNGHGIK